MWLSGVIEIIGAILVGPALIGIFVFGLLALFGMLWSPFAAIVCARKARNRGLDSALFAWKGFAFSIPFLFPFFYLNARLSGAETSRNSWVFTYAILYYVWLVAGIILLAYYIVSDLPRVLNPTLLGEQNDLEALMYLVPAPIINAILWVISLRSLIRRDRLNRQQQDGAAVSSESAYTDSEGAAAGIIPDRAYTNPFGFSLIGTVITLILLIISVGVRFEIL